jgi:hypothetical protein
VLGGAVRVVIPFGVFGVWKVTVPLKSLVT